MSVRQKTSLENHPWWRVSGQEVDLPPPTDAPNADVKQQIAQGHSKALSIAETQKVEIYIFLPVDLQ